MLRNDVELMCANAVQFNSDTDRAGKEARRFFKASTTMFAELAPKTDFGASGIKLNGQSVVLLVGRLVSWRQWVGWLEWVSGVNHVTR